MNGLQLMSAADTGAFALRLAQMLRPDLLLVESDVSAMIRAFDAGALERFVQAIVRARVRPPSGTGASDGPPAPVLIGERQHRMYLLDPARIDYVEAQGNYVTFHVDCAEYVSRDTLKRLELTLQPRGFLRIEHSLLLNVRAIDYVVPFGRGRFVFTLRSGMSLRSTPTYRAGIVERLPLGRGRREMVATTS
jgi:two-component system LytT family response regulator